MYMYTIPSEVTIGNLDTLFIPWINKENEEKHFQVHSKLYLHGRDGEHLTNGFRVNRQIVMDHGNEGVIFKVLQGLRGHYHTRSDDGRIFYLGNPYEMFWTDVGDRRGFTVFDTETLEHFPVDNPYTLFHVLYYNDDDKLF